MAKKKNINSMIPLGGMDNDSDEKFIQENDYIYLLNGIKYEVGEDGIIVNAPGTDTAENVASTFLVANDNSFLVDDYGTVTSTELDGNLPPGKIVGHCKDPKRNGILLFLKGGPGEGSQSVSGSISEYSSIYEFFANGQIYVPIIKNNLVIDVSGDVVYMEVIGDRLFWLERGGTPKTINLIKAYNYTHDTGDKYTTIDEFVISHIKRPPFFIEESGHETIKWGQDTNVNVSHVFDKIFQFRERYIYEDNLRSSWGNISKPAINPDLVIYGDTTVQSGTSNNYIDILFDSGDETVEKVVIAAREGNHGDWVEVDIIDKSDPTGVYTNDGSKKTAALSDSTYYYYRFYNRGGYRRTISEDEIKRIHENIPIEADTITSHYDGRIIFGGNVVDRKFDGNLQLSMEPKHNAISATTTYTEATITITFAAGEVDPVNFPDLVYARARYDMSPLPDILPAGTIVALRSNCDVVVKYTDGTISMHDNYPTDRTISLTETVSKDYFFTNIQTYLDSADEYDDTDYNTSTHILSVEDHFFATGGSKTISSVWVEDDTHADDLEDSRVTDVSVAVASTTFLTSAKRGRHRRYPMQYIDDYGRRSEPLFNDDCEFFIDDYPSSGNLGVVSVDASINHAPPSWAKYYQFLKNSTKEDFIKTNVLYVQPFYDSEGNADGSILLQVGFPVDVIEDIIQQDIDRIQRRIESVVEEIGQTDEDDRRDELKTKVTESERELELQKYDLENPYKRALSDLRAYRFSKGDRLRILKDGGTVTSDSAADPVYKTTGYRTNPIDVQIIDVIETVYDSGGANQVGGVWLKVMPPNTDGYDYTEASATDSKYQNTLIEVYKPSYSENTNIFYEFGAFYKIEAGVHSQPNPSLNPYECYIKSRTLFSGYTRTAKGTEVVDYLEDPNITHDFPSDVYDIGRINILTDIERAIKHPNLIYTDKQFEGTAINGLAQSSYRNQIYLSDHYGDIYELLVSGNTIKAIQAKKITSFYPSNNSILGRKRHSQTDYGTVYPKSVVESPNGYIYGFDVYNGIIWKDTNNGVYNISGRSINRGNQSNYLMGNFFKKMAQDVRDNGIDKGSDDVIAAYDEQYQLVYFSFLHENLSASFYPGSPDTPFRTVIFHEPSNRWVGFLDIDPTGYGYGYNSLLSSNGGDVWVHNRDDVSRCNFYGSQKNFEIQFVANAIPIMRKIFDSMHVHITTDSFNVPSIKVSEDRTNRNGQLSYLNNGHFRLEDGIYAASILNDITSTDDTERTEELYMGDAMRGYTMKFKLRSSDTEKFELFKVDVYYRPS